MYATLKNTAVFPTSEPEVAGTWRKAGGNFRAFQMISGFWATNVFATKLSSFSWEKLANTVEFSIYRVLKSKNSQCSMIPPRTVKCFIVVLIGVNFFWWTTWRPGNVIDGGDFLECPSLPKSYSNSSDLDFQTLDEHHHDVIAPFVCSPRSALNNFISLHSVLAIPFSCDSKSPLTPPISKVSEIYFYWE